MANVLIIGCTSAVAAEISRRYAANGDRLFLVGRSANKMASLMESLDNSVVGSMLADFNDTDKAACIVNQAQDALGCLDIALIAHGDLGDQLRSEQSFAHARQVIETNYISVVSLLIPLTDVMKRQDLGKIGVILSVAGDRGRPRNFTYGSAKGALNLYLQGLRSVLYNTGVEVYGFKMGPVDSPMTVDHEKNFSFTTVERAADGILKGFYTKRYTRYVPGYWLWVMWVVRWLPEPIFQRLGFLSNR